MWEAEVVRGVEGINEKWKEREGQIWKIKIKRRKEKTILTVNLKKI